MSNDRKDVVVIGAGMGGMATAARLAKKDTAYKYLKPAIATVENVEQSGSMVTPLTQVRHF